LRARVLSLADGERGCSAPDAGAAFHVLVEGIDWRRPAWIKLKPSPIAEEALSRIGALYDFENRIRGVSPDERRTLRQQHARPILDELKARIEATRGTAASASSSSTHSAILKSSTASSPMR